MANKTVNLCIYVIRREVNEKDLQRVENDVQRASLIWNQCEIEFKIKTTFTNKEKPDFINFININQEITVCGNLQKTTANNNLIKLLSIRPECDDTDVAVYYVSGTAFSNGVTTSCFFLQEEAGKKQFSIVLTDGATENHLVHELGHALFVRPNDNFDDPDPKSDPLDKIHNTDQCHLMHSSASSIKITQPQCDLANKSKLLQAPMPPPDMFRIIRINGNLFIQDWDWPDDNDVKNHVLSKELKIGPNKTVVDWNFKLTNKDEARVEVELTFSWNIDLSITLRREMRLYEGDDANSTSDLDGKQKSTDVILKDAQNFMVDWVVRNTDEDEPDDYGHLKLFITNAIDPNPNQK